MNNLLSLLIVTLAVFSVNAQSCRKLVGECVKGQVMEDVEDKMDDMKRQIGQCLNRGSCADPMCVKDEAVKVMSRQCGFPRPSAEDKMKMMIFIGMKMKKKMIEKMMAGGPPNFGEMQSKRREMKAKMSEMLGSFCSNADATVNCMADEVIFPMIMEKAMKVRAAVSKVNGNGNSGGGLLGNLPNLFGSFLGRSNSNRQNQSPSEMKVKMFKVFQELHKDELSSCRAQVSNRQRSCRNELAREPSDNEILRMVNEKESEIEDMESEMLDKKEAICDCIDRRGSSLPRALRSAVSQCSANAPSSSPNVPGGAVLDLVRQKLCSNDEEGFMPF